MNDINEILIGACDVYMYEFTGSEVPENAVIETDEHNVGHCSSGFTVDYKPTKYDVKNQYGQIVKSAVTEEAISAKTGVLTWNLANMALLSTGEYVEDGEGATRKIIFTGNGKALKTVLIRAEVTIDAEITGIKKIDGFLASFEEELTEEEAAAIVAA